MMNINNNNNNNSNYNHHYVTISSIRSRSRSRSSSIASSSGTTDGDGDDDNDGNNDDDLENKKMTNNSNNDINDDKNNKFLKSRRTSTTALHISSSTDDAAGDQQNPLLLLSSCYDNNNNDRNDAATAADVDDSSNSKDHNNSSIILSLSKILHCLNFNKNVSELTIRFFRMCEQLGMILLLLMNILAWYFTNGMNGISMQSYATSLLSSYGTNTSNNNNNNADPTYNKDKHALDMEDLSITAVVTVLQLFSGTILGIAILSVLSMLLMRQRKATQQPEQQQQHQQKLFLLATLSSCSWDTSDLMLSSLHGIGSLATNLGFVYGSASLVQIIKLIEPFETLILTKLCSAEESKLLSSAIIASMTTVTMSAIALVQQRKNKPHPAAVFFALCSGLALSSRNVLQRRWYSKHTPKAATTATKASTTSLTTDGMTNNATITSTPLMRKKESNRIEVCSPPHQNTSSYETAKTRTAAGTNSHSTHPTEPGACIAKTVSTTTKTSSAEQQQQKQAEAVAIMRLQQSVMQFTQLSLQSGIMLAIMTAIQLVVSATTSTVISSFTIVLWPTTTTSSSTVLPISWKVFLWHPLYNIFSMITLGFCSALTHSLLNAGKRVVAILMAVLWFREPFSVRTIITLTVIAIGGIWYTVAVQQQQQRKSSSRSGTSLCQQKWMQLLLCFFLLSIVYYHPIAVTVNGTVVY